MQSITPKKTQQSESSDSDSSSSDSDSSEELLQSMPLFNGQIILEPHPRMMQEHGVQPQIPCYACYMNM